MAIRSYAPPKPKARRKRRGGKRATKAQREALQVRMESYFSVNFNDGIQRIRNMFPAADAEKAFRAGNYDAITELLPWGEMGPYFDKAIETLGTAAGKAGAIEQKSLPSEFRDQTTLMLQNQQLDEYLQVRTGALIQGVREDTQVMVQNAVRGAFTGGLTPLDVASQIKSSIGLNERQAQALQNFQGTAKEREAYRDRLQGQRNMMIARTEISFATNKGQLSVYEALQAQGIISADAQKVWIVDGEPCPKICDKMGDVKVPVDEMFVLPDGDQVLCPPAHPNCRCLMSVDVGDDPKSGRENYQDKEDSEQDEEE